MIGNARLAWTTSLSSLCLAVVLMVGNTGCVTYVQTVKPADPLLDATSTSPTLKSKRYKRIMVIPPSADTKGGSFEESLASAEREFLARGLTLISPAVTSRVYQGVGSSARPDLTDMERALMLAKRSNTEALLQIGTFDWRPSTESVHSQRYYLAERRHDSPWYSLFPRYSFREVNRIEFVEAGSTPRITMRAEFLVFTGRLVDVQDGEVVASFSLQGLLVKNLPQDYVATLAPGEANDSWVVRDANFNFYGEWRRDASRDLRDRVFSRVARIIVGQQ